MTSPGTFELRSQTLGALPVINWFLARMGRDNAPFAARTMDFRIGRILRCYEDGTFERYGVRTTYGPLTDLAAWEAAIEPTTPGEARTLGRNDLTGARFIDDAYLYRVNTAA